MVARRHAVAAFRPSTPAGPATAPSRAQTVVLVLAVLAVAVAIAVASFVVKPTRARSFALFYGATFVNDDTSPVAIDLASGKPTVRLHNAFTAVSAAATGDLDMVGLDGGNTLMLNATTGEFNMVDSTGFVVKATDGGVRLPASTAATQTVAVPAGPAAYVLRSGPSSTSVFLVNDATVASAIGGRARARAYATLPAPLAAGRAGAASADGDLWLLTGAGDQHSVVRLSVPPRSNPGVTLAEQAVGRVTGVAAVAVATTGADGSGPDVPAVASGSAVQLFAGDTATQAPVRVDGTVTTILPAANAQGTLAFLYRTSTGWYRVALPTAGGAASTVRLSAIPPGADLVTPAASGGRLYTMDTVTGTLWQINADGSARPVQGGDTYPVLVGEKSDLSQSEVVAHGSRVIFNARSNYLAEVVFTDGSRPPRIIDKHSAVQVDPTGATALTEGHAGNNDHGRPAPKPPKSTPRPAQAVTTRIDCLTTTQTPNIPVLAAGTRASRSIELNWTYPLLENSDCAPSTYVVSVSVLTPGAPATPSTVTVQGQTGVTLTGLFPATQYELTVTAYLNGRGTSSLPIRVSTGPEGPAAPTDVLATPGADGSWTVAWDSCGGVSQGCVPSATWTIVAKVCDGQGLSDVPAPMTVIGDPTVHSFSHVYPGSDALLGRGLCFAVQGQSPQGTIGALSAFTPVAYSWSPPVAADLTLTASQPANTALGGSAATTVDLGLGTDPVRAVGGVGAQVTFTLQGPGAPESRTVTFTGQTAQLSTSFPGIVAGAQYTAQATVHPPNHPTVSVTTPSVPVTTRADWPALTATAGCAPNGTTVVLSCALSVQIGGLSSAAAGGELFTLADSSMVVCGSSEFQLAKADFDPAKAEVTQNVDLTQFSGTCTVNLALREGAGVRTPPVFGGTTSPQFSTSVDLGHATTLAAGPGDFSAAWDSHDGSSVLVKYTGAKADPDVGQIADRWSEQLFAPDGTACGSAATQPTSGGVYVDVNPASCVNNYGDQTGWRFTVSYFDKNTSNQHMQQYTLGGTPPGYVPCTVSEANFAATWDTTPSVDLTFDPTAARTDGCSNWNFSVRNAAQTECGSAATVPGPLVIPVDNTRTECTPAPGFTVVISYRDPAGRSHTLAPITVNGSPPTPTPSPSSS